MLRGDAVSSVANLSQHDTFIAPFKMNENEDFIPDFSFLDEDLTENLEEFDSSFNFNDISLLNCSSESLLDLMCCTDISDPCLLDNDELHDMPSLVAKTANTLDTTVLKEDFNRVLDEWQTHLSGMDRQQFGLDTDDFLLPEELEFLIGNLSSEDEPAAPVSVDPTRDDAPERQTEVVQRVVDCDSEEDEEIDVVSVDEAAVNPFRSMQIMPVDIILGNGKNSKPTQKLKGAQDTKNTLETKKKVPPLLIKKEHKPPPGVMQPRLVSLLSKTNQKTTTPARPKKSILITCPSSPIIKKSKSKPACSSDPAIAIPPVPSKPVGKVCMEDHDYCATSTQKPSAASLPSSNPPTNEEVTVTECYDKIPNYIREQPQVDPKVDAPLEDEVFVTSNDELYNKLPPYMTGLTIAAPQVEVTIGDAEPPKDKTCPVAVREFTEADWKSTSVSKLFERRYRSTASPASSCSSPSRSRSTSHDREGSCSRSGSPSSNGSSCNGDSRSRIDSRKHRRSKHESPSSWDGGGKRSRTKIMEEEKLQQIDDRRIIYVGNIDRSITRADLRRRFNRFGPIEEISIYHRHNGNYGFITFEYRVDAVDAIEHGNDNPNLPRYDLNFGGRRQFCRSDYKDLDSSARNSWSRKKTTFSASSIDFDSLLQATKSLLKAQKKPT